MAHDLAVPGPRGRQHELDRFLFPSTSDVEYSYHHGYWDGADREFRGFARVDQRDAQLFDGGRDT